MIRDVGRLIRDHHSTQNFSMDCYIFFTREEVERLLLLTIMDLPRQRYSTFSAKHFYWRAPFIAQGILATIFSSNSTLWRRFV